MTAKSAMPTAFQAHWPRFCAWAGGGGATPESGIERREVAHSASPTRTIFQT